jgi:hypothetical protein
MFSQAMSIREERPSLTKGMGTLRPQIESATPADERQLKFPAATIKIPAC